MSITLNSVVYNWSGFDQSGTSRWTATAGGVASGFSQLTERVTVPAGSNPEAKAKVKWRVSIPVISSEDSKCACTGTLMRTAYVDIAADFGLLATASERAAVLAAIRDLVLTTEFSNSFKGLVQAAG